MKTKVQFCAVLMWVCTMGPSLASGDEPPAWTQAQQAWESATTLYSSSRYDQAQGLLEAFVRKFPTHEMVPEAYVRISACCALRNNAAGHDEALENVIRKFPHSWWWFAAQDDKLLRLAAQKKNDEYLVALDAMIKVCKEIPTGSASTNTNVPAWLWGSSRLQHDIVAMCDTPARAEKALGIVGPCFKKRGMEMSPEWQMVHVRLLSMAGKADEANKALTAYCDDAGKEPPSLHLLALVTADAQQRGDDKTAAALFDRLLKEYGNCGSMAIHMAARMQYLASRGRTDECVTLGRLYLQRFPNSPLSLPGSVRAQKVVLEKLTTILTIRAVGGDEEARREMRGVLDRYNGKDSLTAMQWEIRVALDANKPEDAAPIVERLTGDRYWSGCVFTSLQNYASRAPNLARYVAQARKKYGVGVLDPNSPAGILYKDLQGRIKSNEVRHMEEVAGKMIDQYPDDPATPEAVKAMVDYYYAKVLVAERDKWMDCMIDRYPRHPLTEQVLLTRVAVLMVDKRHDKAAAAMDMVMERFPTSEALTRDWYADRLALYSSAKDPNGYMAFVHRLYDGQAALGDIFIKDDLVRYEFWQRSDSNNLPKEVGDWWLEQARKCSGTQSELDCLARALEAYKGRGRHELICLQEARKVIDMLRDQAIDPEMKWKMEFEDVNLLSAQMDGNAAVQALGAHLTAKRYRDLSTRLNMEAFSAAVCRPSATAPTGADMVALQAADQLAAKMRKLCYTRRDQIALNCLTGDILLASKAPVEALGFYARAVDDGLWPAQELSPSGGGAITKMLAIFAKEPAQIAATIEPRIAKCRSAQDVVPRLYAAMAKCQVNKDPSGFQATYRKLVDNYPASGARGEVEAMIAAAAKNKDKKK